MNRIKICKIAFAKMKKMALLFLFTLTYSTGNAQITLSSGAEAAYDKKVQKSPAKDAILQSDRAIKKVYAQHSSGNDAKTLIGYNEALFVASYNAYDSLEYYKKEILRLYPKWKVKRIETCQTTYAAKHTEFSAFYIPYRDGQKKCEEYEVYFSNVDKKVRSLIGKGHELYLYVTGQDEDKFNLTAYRKMEKEALELLKTHQQFDKYRNRWVEPDITGLDYLKINDEGSYSYSTFLGYEIDYFKESTRKGWYFRFPLKESSFPEVLKELADFENAYYRAKSALFLFPEHTGANEIYNDVEGNYKKFEAYKEKVAISPFHKENMGKIFFADHKINFGQETAADFKTEFKAGETIYVISYDVEPFYLKNHREFKLFVAQGDEWQQLDLYYAVSSSDGFSKEGQTIVYQYCLTPSQNLKLTTAEYAQAERPLACLSALKPGDHVIRINTYTNSATFNLKVNETNAYQQSYEYAHTVYQNSIPLPKAGMTDASVHDWVVKAFANSDSDDLDGVQFLRTIIVSKEWDYTTNRYTNQITDRSCEIIMVCKDKNGDCFIWSADFEQSKAGSVWTTPGVGFNSGLYIGEDYYRGDSDSRVYLNCSKF